MKNRHLIRFLVPALILGGTIAYNPRGSEAQTLIIAPPPGGPLPGLSNQDIQRFNGGRQEFTRGARIEDGLGPVFNGTSCVQCHRAGAPGGASADGGISVVTRIGGTVNGAYSDLANVGGALIQARSLREIFQNYPVPREVIPSQATFISRRITTPVFGLGLVEAIPSADILERADPDDADHDGISGKANMVVNAETGLVELGRYGWKCQVPTLHAFNADAFLNEMGITNNVFTMEVLPQGLQLPPGADTVPDPEDTGGRVNRVTDFMRLSRAPAPDPRVPIAGVSAFYNAGCVSCHTPYMTTGFQSLPSLSNQNVGLYSDLLVHNMGAALSDGVVQGQAAGDEWRTAPLWGLRFRTFLLHDGRARSIDQAIRLHGGEGLPAATRYINMTSQDRAAMLSFLAGL